MLNYQQPDARGHFGPVDGGFYGGSFVAETLVHALDELNAAYAHYRDDAAFQAEFKYELAHFVGRPSPIYHAARMAPGVDLLKFALRFKSAQALLLDAHVEGYGGGGKAFDWSLIPPSVPVPVVLSGGLNAANVIEGIARVRPWAVDVSSGVESAKGIKDAEAMRRFCAAVREADARAADHPLRTL